MAKKKASRRAARESSEAEFEDDSMSSASSSTFPDGSDLEERSDEDSMFEEALDSLLEKRSSTRENALKYLANHFSRTVSELAEERFDTLLMTLTSCLRKGGPTEQTRACQVIGLMAVTLGGGDSLESLLAELQPLLLRAAGGGRSSAVQEAAVFSLSILEFVAMGPYPASHTSLTTSFSSSLECFHSLAFGSDNPKAAAKPVEPELRFAALSSWSLLMSSLQEETFCRVLSASPPLSPCLPPLLSHSNQRLKAAATDAALLLMETLRSDWLENWDDQPEAGSSSAEDDQEDCDDYDDLDGALDDKMHSLVLAASAQRRRVPRQRRGAERRQLATMMSAVEGRRFQPISIKLRHGDRVEITSHSKSLQINALRSMLTDGFQRHLQENEFLHALFGYEPRREKVEKFRSAVQKRHEQSPNSFSSRSRAVERRRSRKQQQESRQGHFSVDYGDSLGDL